MAIRVKPLIAVLLFVLWIVLFNAVNAYPYFSPTEKTFLFVSMFGFFFFVLIVLAFW